MSNSSHQPTAPQDVSLSEIVVGSQNSVMAFLNSYEKWVRSTVQIQSELMDFVSMRMKKDLQIPQRLAQCSDTADLIEQHMEITSTMIKDYADENQKIMKLISQATLDIELETETALSDGAKRKSS